VRLGGAVDLGSTLRPRAKAAATGIVLGKGAAYRCRSTYIMPTGGGEAAVAPELGNRREE
jgi:hypothetical protein